MRIARSTIAFATPAAALFAALLLPAGLAPAHAATLQPSAPTPAVPREAEHPRATTSPHLQPQAPASTMNAPARPQDAMPPKSAGVGKEAPLGTLNDTKEGSREGIHKTPTSPKTGSHAGAPTSSSGG